MMKFGGKLSAPYVEQETRRGRSLVTPITFDVALGGSPTTIYTGLEDFSLLLRKALVVNNTAGALSFTMRVGGNVIIPSTNIATLTTTVLTEVEGFLVNAETDVTATGSGLRLVGWGVKVQGGDGWVL